MLWVKVVVTLLLLTILVVGSFWIYDSYKSQSLPPLEDEPAVEPEAEIRSTVLEEEAPPAEQVRVAEKPAAKITVSGTVMNHAYPGLSDVHVPAAAAEITAVLANIRDFGRERKVFSKSTISTEESGDFFFAFDDPGFRPVFVTFTAKEDALYRGQAETFDIGEGRLSLKDIVITRTAFGVLEGETVDSEGLPLAGVRVRFGGDGQEVVAYSDGQGRLSVTGLTRTGGISASLDGYIVYTITRTGRKKGGGWRPIRIVLVPTGRLLVHLEDSEGKPLAGRSVRIGLSSKEPRAPGAVIPRHDALCAGKTDTSGTARFDGLWTGKKLRITVQMTTGKRKYAERMLSGRLVYEGRDVKGSPIVIPRNGLLEVTAGETVYFELRGTVYFPDHRPVPLPKVMVHDLDEPAWKKRRMKVLAKGDEQGRYSMRIPEGENRARLEVTAIDLGGWGYYRPKFEHAGRAEALMKDAREGVLEQDLVLEPVLSISGCVLDAERKPAHGKVHAVPAGSGYMRASTSLGMEAYSRTKEGVFSIKGLPSGSYDLYATQELKKGYPHITACHLFPGIEAGSQGLELVLPEKRSVNIRIDVQAEEGRLNRLAVLHSKFIPRQGWKTSAPPAPQSMTVSSLTDWPSRTPMQQMGSNNYQDARGYRTAAFYQTSELENHQLPAMEEGWYIVGVEGFDENGNAYYPVATRLMRFAPGSYTISFNLVPTTSVEGRVHLQGDTRVLYLSLKDSNGDSLFFETRASKTTNFLPLGGDGSFLMSQVPVGRFTLCVGTVHDLSRGQSVVERPVHILPGKNPFLEIRLP